MTGDRPHERVMHAELERQAAKYGDRTFVHFKGHEFGFQAVNAMADRVASGLQKLGVRKGDKVAVLLDNCPEFIFALFGLSKLGAVQVPINTAHKGSILSYMLDQSDSSVLVTHSHYLDRVQRALANNSKIRMLIVHDTATRAELPTAGSEHKLTTRTMRWDELVENDGSYQSVEVLFFDPFAIMFTSGTTGLSKGVLTPHNLPISVSERLCEAAALTDNDRLYSILPLFHSGGQVVGVTCALHVGARVVVAERFSASGFWDDVRRYGCTEFAYAGSILPMLLAAKPNPEDANNPMRVALGGGATREISIAFERRFGVAMLEFYGQSEIGVPLVSDHVNRKAGACGKVHADFVGNVVDDYGIQVGPNTPGELLIRPVKPYIIGLEYYRMPEKTIEAWRDLWHHTGELLEYDDEGYFYFLDRKKDALRRRGENISSLEIESVLNQHPAVLESAAIGVRSGMGPGEDEVMVCLTPKPGFNLEPLELIKYCEDRMAYFMVPRYLRFLETMPKTASMRIEKYKLRAEGVTPDTWDREKTGYKLAR